MADPPAWSIEEQAVLIMERNVRALGATPIPVRTNDPGVDDPLGNIIVLPRLATFRLMDGRSEGSDPVVGALVRSIEIEAAGETYTLGVFETEDLFINDWYPLQTTPPYRATAAASFEKVRRREWVQHLRLWLRKLGRYSGRITGLPPLNPSTDLTQAIVEFWRDATGLALTQYGPDDGHLEVADLLTAAASGVYMTNGDGELKIPLPLEVACKVTVHFRELQLVDASAYSSGDSCSMAMDSDDWYRLPSGSAAAAKYKLTETLTFNVAKGKNDHVTTAYTQVWCQPVSYDHLSLGGSRAERERQIIPDPARAAPTLFVPTVVMGSGPRYGNCGFVRNYGSATNPDPTRHGSKWYSIVSWGSLIGTHASEDAARNASNISATPPTSYKPSSGGQWQVREVNKYYGPFDSKTRAQKAKYHAGHDLAGLDGDSKVFALKGGRVVWINSQDSGAGGKAVNVVSSADGVVFTHSYAHLDSVDVRKGETVQAGQVLGTMGRTGNIDGNGTALSTYPTHCHFYLKARAENATDRHQNYYSAAPGSDGFFRHKPAAMHGPRHELRAVTLTVENKKCVPDDTTFHLLPCAGEPNSGANFSSGRYSRWKAGRCPNLPASIRQSGGTTTEHDLIRTNCWARQSNRCPWDQTAALPVSRYYRYEFTGQELQMIGTSATGEQVINRWTAYSGRAAPGTEIARTPGIVWDTVYHAKRFGLSTGRQKLQDEGPIPEGLYRINVDDVIDFSTLPAYKRLLKYTYSAWGDFAVSLVAGAATKTHGRSGFYIHGGDEWGSAGCIDLHEKDRDFFSLFKADPDGIKLFEVTVNYNKSYVETTDEVIVDQWG